jgi:hypothetical protein
MKLREQILSRAWEKKEYYWIFAGNKIPRLISGKARDVEALLDIKNHHDQQVENNKELPNVQAFKEFMSREFPKLEIIEEFPIPIDRSFWKFIGQIHGLEDQDMEKLWFSLDFYIPQKKLSIQLDSIIGHGEESQKKRDKAEDIYLGNVYDIATIRTSQLQFEDKREEECRRLKKLIRGYEDDPKTKFDFTSEFREFFLEYYGTEIRILEDYYGSKIKKEGDEVYIDKSQMSWKVKKLLEKERINSFVMEGIEVTIEENIKYLVRNFVD